LLAVLSHKSSKVFLADENTIVRITSNIPEHVEAYQHDLPEKVANFSDESKQKEILLDRFLRRTDNAIGLLLNAYKTPLFVMGTDRTLGHFKALSKNTRHIVDYIHGNFDEKTPFELQQLMKPHVQDWKKIKEVKMLKLIEEAAGKKKLAEGIDEVWKSAALKKGRIMIVENDFVYQARQGGLPEVIYGKDELSQSAFYIKDAVDDAIEKVLSAGGDVEFVGHDVLKERGRVVLIEYY
jgi:hypothetical protein